MSNLEADSGYIFQRTLLYQLSKIGYDIYLIGPPNMPDLPGEIQTLEIPISESKFGVRLGLDWEKVRKILSLEKPVDILLINQSELTLPLKLLCYEAWNKNVFCVTYYHYLAIQESTITGPQAFDPSLNLYGAAKAIWNRQVESAYTSDINIVGSEFAKNLFLTSVMPSDHDLRIDVIPPPVQDFEKPIHLFKDDVNGVSPKIFYNHRLYEHYGGLEIFDYLKELYSEMPFELIVTNPTNKRSSLRNKLDPSVSSICDYIREFPFVQLNHMPTQKKYYDEIDKVLFGVGPLRHGALWSMAVADLMSRGKPVVCFKSGALPEIINDPDLVFSTKKEFLEIARKLMTETDFYCQKSDMAMKRAKKLFPKNIAEKFNRLIRERYPVYSDDHTLTYEALID